jgi:nitrogen fixation protein FixH
MTRTEPASLRPSLWIPWTIAGCFVLVVIVNVLMAWCAAWSWPGLVSPSAYDQGLAYNRNLAAEMRQRMLGWRCRFLVEGGVARVELHDRDGAPLTGAEITATFERPDREGSDFALPLAAEGPGVYAAPVTVPAPGAWKVHVTARRGADLVVTDARLELRNP